MWRLLPRITRVHNMAFLFIVIGGFLIATGIHDQSANALKQLGSDGKGLISLAIVIAVVGGLGYIQGFKPLSNAFLALVIIVLLLSSGGFFDNISSDISTLKAKL